MSSGFYLINDIRDAEADLLHPEKRLRPVAAGELAPAAAGMVAAILIAIALTAGAFVGIGFLLVLLAYGGLMAAYNLTLKHVVIIDVFAIAAGFVLRAVGGAIAVDVSISSWLLVCTMLLALLVGFGKRRYELTSLVDAAGHRRNLENYSQGLLDQAVAVTAAGTLIAYAVYTFDGDSVPANHGMMLTIPIVAYGVFRYLFLLYQRGSGGTPETMVLRDRALFAAVVLWALTSTLIFYLGQ
jgi:4-hydroxybenzoate polyprenyltransferase